MVLPNSAAISTAWRALENLNDLEGWRSIPISSNGNCTLRAGRRYPLNVEALLVGFNSIGLTATHMLPQANGFNVERISVGNSDKWLALVRQSEGSQELFTQMVIDLADLLTRNTEKQELELYQLFIGRLHTWQNFMQKSHGHLSSAAELGLVGEMRFLDILLNTALPLHTAVDAWKGPLDGLQDFELGTGAVEVKSTLASNGFLAHIISLEQLDDSVRHPLFICGCRFATSTHGQTLPQRVHALRQRLISDTSALTKFNTGLLFAGYLDFHAEHYVRQFVNIDELFLLVDDTFPRLVMGNVPTSIRDVQYEIDLDNLLHHQTKLAEIMIRTGMVLDGIN
ncbi:MZA anti-phage system associated PD-(D/E)XK motif protein MzaD [uncultured Thiothrix sp.]|uniref:MZA anti-phage system associated PD-(D/E)XK motif protein MzaD n=1 Tax=uncultured Thiothrix sp. TaxID=223185 RepID=UPI00260EAE2B|nr:MZA anti-phage system associated PD-(D/E)XK motif protein MzaD [uncultured Thiothrix sp.]